MTSQHPYSLLVQNSDTAAILGNKANPVGVVLFLCRHFLSFNKFSKLLTSRLKTLYVIYPDKILENNKTLWYIKDNLNFSNTKQDDKRHFTEKVEKRWKIKCPCKSLRLTPHLMSPLRSRSVVHKASTLLHQLLSWKVHLGFVMIFCTGSTLTHRSAPKLEGRELGFNRILSQHGWTNQGTRSLPVFLPGSHVKA